MQIDTQSIENMLITSIILDYGIEEKHNFQRDRFETIHNKFWIEIYFGRNILLVNSKLIYPILVLILQLSQKFGEIFDDIGIKVFLVVKFCDLVIEKKQFQHLQKIF